ncbi:MAG: hypothetical protein WC405_12640 [Syntrophales bacterium]
MAKSLDEELLIKVDRLSSDLHVSRSKGQYIDLMVMQNAEKN